MKRGSRAFRVLSISRGLLHFFPSFLSFFPLDLPPRLQLRFMSLCVAVGGDRSVSAETNVQPPPIVAASSPAEVIPRREVIRRRPHVSRDDARDCSAELKLYEATVRNPLLFARPSACPLLPSPFLSLLSALRRGEILLRVSLCPRAHAHMHVRVTIFPAAWKAGRGTRVSKTRDTGRFLRAAAALHVINGGFSPPTSSSLSADFTARND